MNKEIKDYEIISIENTFEDELNDKNVVEVDKIIQNHESLSINETY